MILESASEGAAALRLYSALASSSLQIGATLRRRVAAEGIRDLLAAVALVSECLRAGNKVIFFGNGGSAADAQHLAAELVGRYKEDRRPLAGIALTCDSSALTAIGNDYGFVHVFSRQVLALAHPGDVVFAITTSGRSANVRLGIAAAHERGAKVVGLTSARADAGFASACDVVIRVPSTDVARIQEIHITLGHVIIELVEVHGDAPFPSIEPAFLVLTKLSALDDLARLREYYRAQSKTVVWTNGCFDVLHAGHIRSLTAARDQGDVLIVGLNSDASVRALKGEGRPVFPAEDRAEMLSALEAVDHVVIFDEPTPVSPLERLRPDVHCKGADYEGKTMPEEATVRAYGGRIVLLPLVPDLSTTSILKRL
jgi:rfaE bifunctional protein nucleotidyltransferase chain/domain